jgi:hypothetical protein
VALLGAVAVLLSKRGKARQAESDLWTEATAAAAAPDLR